MNLCVVAWSNLLTNFLWLAGFKITYRLSFPHAFSGNPGISDLDPR